MLNAFAGKRQMNTAVVRHFAGSAGGISSKREQRILDDAAVIHPARKIKQNTNN